MSARLIFLTGSRAGTAVDLGDDDLTFGRDPSCSVTFSSGEIVVSAQHATITRRGDRYVLRDNDSRNGTFVDADRIAELTLEEGHLVQFGAGGPAARFVVELEAGVERTLDPADMARSMELIERTKREAATQAKREAPEFTSTRELVAVNARHAARRALVIAALTIATLITVITVILWQARSRYQLERALADLSVALADEQSSRVALARDVAAVEAQYDSLRDAVQAEQEKVERNPRIDADVIQRYSQGVALISFVYGYAERDGDRLLRYVVDSRGQRRTTPGPDGQAVPSIALGGSGPPLKRLGTASGFLVDSNGLLLTNRHVAQPWLDDSELAALRSRGLDVEGRIFDLRAYLPPGDQSAPLVVEAVSDRADVAVMRMLTEQVAAPVLPLASRAGAARPGDQLIFIGYPTGVHNLLFRVNRDERATILRTANDDPLRLLALLAERRLIQPLITNGAVSDTTATEVIHTAVTTVGGSGGPLIGTDQHVVALHYAVVVSPNPADPFRTQRAVPIRYVWEILPRALLPPSLEELP